MSVTDNKAHHTYKTLVAERVVDTTQEKPKGPQVFKAELEKKICCQHKQPYQEKLDVHKGAAKIKETGNMGTIFRSINMYFM